MSTVRLQREMKYEEAAKVLGFKETDVIAPHLPAFKRAEEKLAELIASTDNEELKSSYREELAKLNEAVRVVQEGGGEARPKKRGGSKVLLVFSVLVIGTLISAAWMGNRWVNDQKEAAVSRQVEGLMASGRIAVEKHRWPEAEEFFNEVVKLRPGSKRGLDGLRSIEEGKAEEQRQHIGWLMGLARSAVDGRDWEGAEKAAAEVAKLVPDNEQVPKILEAIEEGRAFDKVADLLELAENAIREEQWKALGEHSRELERLDPNHVDLPRVQALAAEGMRLLEERRVKARELYLTALEMDDGEYSGKALELLREAIRLEARPEYKGLYEKISSHARILRVPEDYPTITEALATARDKDKVKIAEGRYEEALTLAAAVDLEGAGPEKTVIECPAGSSSVVTARQAGRGARIAGMTLRQSGIALTDERFPVVAVDQGELVLEDCWVENGSGHGVAVINGSAVVLRNVRVMKCGWDGLAVSGASSRASVIEGRFSGNLHHGIDAWDGGAVSVKRTRCSENGLAGIVLMSPGVKSTVEGSTSDTNRELGIQVSNGAVAELSGNQFLSNLLGGVLVQDAGTQVSIYGNRVMKNGKVGIVVDKQSELLRFDGNESVGNEGEQVRLKAELARVP